MPRSLLLHPGSLHMRKVNVEFGLQTMPHASALACVHVVVHNEEVCWCFVPGTSPLVLVATYKKTCYSLHSTAGDFVRSSTSQKSYFVDLQCLDGTRL